MRGGRGGGVGVRGRRVLWPRPRPVSFHRTGTVSDQSQSSTLDIDILVLSLARFAHLSLIWNHFVPPFHSVFESRSSTVFAVNASRVARPRDSLRRCCSSCCSGCIGRSPLSLRGGSAGGGAASCSLSQHLLCRYITAMLHFLIIAPSQHTTSCTTPTTRRRSNRRRWPPPHRPSPPAPRWPTPPVVDRSRSAPISVRSSEDR